MKQIILNGKELLLVEAPEGFWAYHFNHHGDIEAYPEDGGGGTKPIAWHCYKSDMPPGDWQLLFADPISPSEDECKGVVEEVVYPSEPIYYKVYHSTRNVVASTSALKSWHSFVRSHGFKHPKRVIALIKKP